MTSIGHGAFGLCKNLKSITLPEGVTSIGNMAFDACESLTSVTLPSSLTSFGDMVPAGIPVEIAEGHVPVVRLGRPIVTTAPSVSSLGTMIFDCCESLQVIYAPKGSYAEQWAKNRRFVVLNEPGMPIPTDKPQDDVWTMPANAFFYTIEDGKVTIDGLTGEGFENVDAVPVWSIPAEIEGYPVTCIGHHAIRGWWYDCGNIRITESVTRIEECAFIGMDDLSNIDIPKSVSYIGNDAFEYTIWFQEQIEDKDYLILGDGVLYWVNKELEGLFTIPKGVKCIGDSVFCDHQGLTGVDIPDGVTYIGGSAFFGCEELTSVDIPDGVTYIGEYAFGDCYAMTSVDIPDGVTHIGYGAFEDCISLTSIRLPEGLTGIDKWLCNRCSSLTNIYIPESVTYIGEVAFGECKSITSVNIPEGVTSIGKQAFFHCVGLTSIYLPDNITHIGGHAFMWCTNLADVHIPDRLQYIGSAAFGDTPWNMQIKQNRKDVVLGDGILYWVSPTVYDYDFSGIKSIGPMAFYGNQNLKSITIPEGITGIGSYAFGKCSNLTDIKIPESVTYIEDYSFSHCTSLTSVNIPKGITEIEDGLFYGCKSLTSIEIPENVSNIGSEAFGWCMGLTNIEIPKGVFLIYGQAFGGCAGLTSIEIPEGVEYMFDSTFEGCINLKSVRLPESLIYVFPADVPNQDHGMFMNCGKLTSILVKKDSYIEKWCREHGYGALLVLE